jgi:hypothetical protein
MGLSIEGDKALLRLMYPTPAGASLDAGQSHIIVPFQPDRNFLDRYGHIRHTGPDRQAYLYWGTGQKR